MHDGKLILSRCLRIIQLFCRLINAPLDAVALDFFEAKEGNTWVEYLLSTQRIARVLSIRPNGRASTRPTTKIESFVGLRT